jgi:hypothetical protein
VKYLCVAVRDGCVAKYLYVWNGASLTIAIIICKKGSRAISLHSRIVVKHLARARSITTPDCLAVYHTGLLGRSEARPLSYVARL